MLTGATTIRAISVSLAVCDGRRKKRKLHGKTAISYVDLIEDICPYSNFRDLLKLHLPSGNLCIYNVA